MTFEELNLAPELLAALTSCGYTEPTPIQAQAIPHLLAGRDLIGSAQTGTGKTAAFVLPALQRLAASGPSRPCRPQRRRLAFRPGAGADARARAAGRRAGRPLWPQPQVNTVCIYGGAPYPIQNRDLARGADIIVATPGRLIDHLERGRIDLSTLQVLVLDEADRMLDMGFVDDVERIALLAPKTRQTVLFSATFDGAIARLSARLLRDAVRIDIQSGQGGAARDRAARPFCRRPLAQAPDPRSPAGRHRHHAEHRLHRDETRRRVPRAAAEGRRSRRGGAARRHESARAHAHDHRHAARSRAHAGGDRRRRARHRRGRHQPRDQLRPAAPGRRLRPPDRPHRARGRRGDRGVAREPCRTRSTAPDRALHRGCDTCFRNSRTRASSPRAEIAGISLWRTVRSTRRPLRWTKTRAVVSAILRSR